MFSRRNLWVAVAVLLAAGWWMGSGSAAENEPAFDAAEAPAEGGMTAAEKAKRANLIQKFSRQLGTMKPYDSTKKSVDDYYVIGTGKLDPTIGHADVCFQVKQGQKEVAEFLVDYMAESSEQSIRKWHVFSRLKDAQQAEQALLMIRMQYDQMAAYQEQIRRIYNAQTCTRT